MANPLRLQECSRLPQCLCLLEGLWLAEHVRLRRSLAPRLDSRFSEAVRVPEPLWMREPVQSLEAVRSLTPL